MSISCNVASGKIKSCLFLDSWFRLKLNQPHKQTDTNTGRHIQQWQPAWHPEQIRVFRVIRKTTHANQEYLEHGAANGI